MPLINCTIYIPICFVVCSASFCQLQSRNQVLLYNIISQHLSSVIIAAKMLNSSIANYDFLYIYFFSLIIGREIWPNTSRRSTQLNHPNQSALNVERYNGNKLISKNFVMLSNHILSLCFMICRLSRVLPNTLRLCTRKKNCHTSAKCVARYLHIICNNKRVND